MNSKSANASVVFSDAIRTSSNEDMYLILLSDNSDRRIIGDRAASYLDWQFMVLLTNIEESKVCGGTLIRNNFVLTSAWCITQGRSHLPKIFVSYNLHYLRQQDLVCTYGIPIIHPQYQHARHGATSNDIALVKLDTGVTIPTSKLAKLTLDHQDVSCTSPPNKYLKVASWAVNNVIFPSTSGNTEIHFNSKRSLYEIDQKWTNVLHCVTLLGIPTNEATKFICTKTHKTQPSIGKLLGEGGSPLMSNHEQVGIATGPSYRKTLEKCGLSIWTNIAPYLSWINNVIANSNCYVRQYNRDKGGYPFGMESCIDATCRKIKLYSCNQKRGNDEDDTCYSSFFNKLYMLCRNGARIFGSNHAQSREAGSYCETNCRQLHSIEPPNSNYTFDPLICMFPNSQLINLFEIQIGITIFFCFLLCFKVCG